MRWPFSKCFPETDIEDVVGQTYDYIIVGAGTAGCALASRLSENPNIRVLLLEKGPVDDTWASSVPLLSCDFSQFASTVYHSSESDPHCGGRSLRYVSAEAVGGSSRINGMLYTRGTSAIYDEWERLGHLNWSWSAVEPYFDRIEGTSSTRPTHVQISQEAPEFEVYEYMRMIAPELGIPVHDGQSKRTDPSMGYKPFSYTIDSKFHRHSALHSYLPRYVAIQRKATLTVCTNVIVTRVKLDTGCKRAVGVWIQSRHGCAESAHTSSSGQEAPKFLISAKREIILCGGAISSPQILQLSGIGPARLLYRHGIELKIDLPGIGKGLADHQAIPICIEIPLSHTLKHLEKSPFYAIWQLFQYALVGTGWMASSTTQAAIWINTARLDTESFTLASETGDRTSEADVIPDVEIMMFPANGASETYSKPSLFTLYICLLRPQSRGVVEIRSADPLSRPLIRPNLLSEPEDLVVARKAVRFTLHLAKRFIEAWPHPAKLFLAPGKENFGQGWKDVGDEEIDGFIRANIKPVYHLTSSCAMGRVENGGGVDDELRVHGLENLRVADASIFPTIPAAHTMAPTYMVAERCADFVNETWSRAP